MDATVEESDRLKREAMSMCADVGRPAIQDDAERLVDWSFSGENGEEPAPGTSWIRSPAPAGGPDGVSPRLLAAMTDFCQALLISNEFLYLH